MARRTERAQVAPTTGATVNTGVYAPSSVAVSDAPVRSAQALTQALGVATKGAASLEDRIYAKAELHATRAFMDGIPLTPKEMKSDAARLAVESLSTERAFTDFQNNLAADYETARHQPGFEINSYLNSKIQGNYFGLDPEKDIDQHVLGYLTPRLEQVRANYVTEEAKRSFEDIKTQKAADAVTIVDNIRASGRAPTGQEWADMESHLWDIGRNDPEYVNQTMLAVVQKAAADGDVATVNSVPATWGENNVPSIRTNAKYAAHFENALIGAQSQNYTNSQRIDAEKKKALADLRETTEQGITDNMLSGRNPINAVQNALRNNTLTAERADSVVSNWRAMNAAGPNGEGYVNNALAIKLEGDLLAGKVTVADLNDAIPHLGAGDKLRTAVTHLREVAKNALDDKLQTPQAKSWLSIVENYARPTQGAFDPAFNGTIDSAQQVARAQALRVAQDQMLNSMDPEKAAKNAMALFDTIKPKFGAGNILLPAESPEEKRNHLRALIDAGQITDQEALSLY